MFHFSFGFFIFVYGARKKDRRDVFVVLTYDVISDYEIKASYHFY